MAQSKLTIYFDSDIQTINLNIQNFADSNSPIINKKATIPDPDSYASDNIVLIACGHNKHEFTIDGYCSLTNRATLMDAMNGSVMITPEIYPGGGSTNVITANAYYFITNFSGKFANVNEYYWYSMTFIYGGTTV